MAAFRVLYVVTTFYSQTRWREMVVPTVRAATESVSLVGWEIDVVVIVGNEGPNSADKLDLENALPKNSALDIWENACPLGYDGRTKEKLSCISRALARQHRFVVGDRVHEYDFFACWEDDMRIDAGMIRYYLELSEEIDRIGKSAPHDLKTDPTAISGPMSQRQLQRVVPGFIRVEIVRGKEIQGVPTPIVPDAAVGGWQPDASRCCSVASWDTRLPRDPLGSELMAWETRIHGMSVRHFPEPVGWAALIPGPRQMPKEEAFGSRWSGAAGEFGHYNRPGEREPQLFAQQGGWMATREQVLYFDEACPEGFLPPFKSTKLRKHGMDPSQPHNVEFWSGGFQLFGTCNIQRIISLDPDRFSSHLIYHSANNKQDRVPKSRHARISDLYGELITVKKSAEIERQKN